MRDIQKFSLLKRKTGLSKQEFFDYWRNIHGPLLASIPEYWKYNSSYIQSVALPVPGTIGTESPYDGVAQTIQRPREDMQRGFFDDDKYLELVRPDELEFLDVEECTAIWAEQHVIKDGPRTGVKFMSLLRPVEGMSVTEFQRYWLDRHAPLVRSVAPFWNSIRRYVQNHGIPAWSRGLSVNGKISPFVGVAELWFDSIEGIEHAFTEEEYMEKVKPDEGRFIAKPTTRFIISEYVVEPLAGKLAKEN